ncbi:DUF5677 domain-containing protein [Brevibacterium sp. R8603A2]|uniref:DUF5677 domain-containing protein n=1 Tax=Brevibacterium sp. R8603A2 TaxID=2929779 RepID=UPI001FFAFB71|nr:DUF5677 domain-containing protein [Brevibacterium sp. R8603A2]MCK1801793.1 DUF5677 domain-containing protein [Brevibacterium sp. R8603A2]
MNGSAPDDQFKQFYDGALEVIEAWETSRARDDGKLTLRKARQRRKVVGINLRVTTVTLALASHVVTLSKHIFDGLEDGRVLESIPVIRTSYETALTAQWVRLLGDDAASAIINTYRRKQDVLQKEMSRSENPTIRGASDDFPGLELADFPTQSQEQAKRFQQMTEDLDQGKEMYLYYRIMCDFSHVSVSIMDHYFSEDPSVELGTIYRHQPKQPSRELWSFFALQSLCLALAPLAELLPDKTLRKALRSVAKSCGLTTELTLSRKYWQRLRMQHDRRHGE